MFSSNGPEDSTTSEDDLSDTLSGKPKVPLDKEWADMAKKMLKGADPEKKLTWRTAEVCTVYVCVFGGMDPQSLILFLGTNYC